MARSGIRWTASQRLQQPDLSPWFFGLILAYSADLLSAAPGEVGKPGFLQIIYRTHHYVPLILLLASLELHFNIAS